MNNNNGKKSVGYGGGIPVPKRKNKGTYGENYSGLYNLTQKADDKEGRLGKKNKREENKVQQNQTENKNDKALQEALDNIESFRKQLKGDEDERNVRRLKRNIDQEMKKVAILLGSSEEKENWDDEDEEMEDGEKDNSESIRENEGKMQNGTEEMEDLYENNEAKGTDDITHNEWNDSKLLNKKLKTYEIKMQGMTPGKDEERTAMETMIQTMKFRIDELLQKEASITEEANYEKINMLSNVVINHDEEWDDLSFVNNAILELEKETVKEEKQEDARQIREITERYKARKSELIMKLVQHDEKKLETKTIAEAVEEVEKGTNSSKVSSGDKRDDQLDELMEDGHESDEGSTITLQSTGTMGMDDRKSSLTRKVEQWQHGGKDARDNKKTKYQHERGTDLNFTNALQKMNLEKDKEREPEQSTGRVPIRVRFQFRTEQLEGKSRGEQMRRILHDIMTCIKAFDPTATLLPWKESSGAAPLNGNEILLLSGDSMREYVDMPGSYDVKLQNRRMYYKNGLHLMSKMKAYEFVEEWSNHRYYNSQKSAIWKNTTMREAEMQSSSEAYPVGYFLGSVEKGEYSTIKRHIREMMNENIELSYQFINQREISPRVWQNAKETAEKDYPNPTSREHRRIKYKNAPAALIAFVSDENKRQTVRRKLFDEYGKTNEGCFPLMADGSRMKFIPMFNGRITKEETKESLYEYMQSQATTKAGDVIMQLDITDIFEPKRYLKGRTIEEIIHSATTNNNETNKKPLIKHIVRRWTKNVYEKKYEVVVAANMVTEAGTFLEHVEEALKQEFGNEVQRHFRGGRAITMANNRGRATNDEDLDLETMIISEGKKDKEGGFLLEGMEIVKLNQQEKAKKNQYPNNKETGSNEESVSTMSGISGISTLSRSTRDTNMAVQWEIGENGKERTVESMKKAEITKMKIHLAKYNLQLTEVKEWIEKNLSWGKEVKYQSMASIMQKIDYRTQWKEMIGDVIESRKMSQNEAEEDFADESIDRAIAAIPSSEFEGGGGGKIRASHLNNEEPLHQPTRYGMGRGRGT